MRKIVVVLFTVIFMNCYCLGIPEDEAVVKDAAEGDMTEEKMKNALKGETQIANVIIKKVQINPRRLFTLDTATNAPLTFELPNDTQIFSRILYENCAFTNLKKDMVLIVEYEQLEDGLVAKNIEVLKGLSTLIEGLAIGIVKEVNLKQGYILLSNASIDDKKFDELLIYIDQFTKIRTSKDTTLLSKNILKTGQELRIITSGLFTNSNPPETVGLEVILILLQ